MIFDHIVLIVSNYQKSKHFYSHALSPLDISFIREEDNCAGFGSQNKPSLWIAQEENVQKPMHIAFIAPDRASVDAFYAEALAAGGRDNGKPGIRDNYSPNYYAAFVIDPDGHNIEAVCRDKSNKNNI
jgi:catechol 2,3-dioxygenase-like lactoylglutathione lyase family enzyme